MPSGRPACATLHQPIIPVYFRARLFTLPDIAPAIAPSKVQVAYPWSWSIVLLRADPPLEAMVKLL